MKLAKAVDAYTGYDPDGTAYSDGIRAGVIAGVTSERQRIANRVRELRILRLQIGADPLEEINNVIQTLANDIESNWEDYLDDDDD